MTTLLHIDASVGGDASLSRQASARLVSGQGATRVITRDLAATPLPQITGEWAAARLVPADALSDAERAELELSDALVAELEAADTIVIGLPIYNFGMPASLKAWVDLVARPKRTFQYTETGPEGLLKGKRAIIAVASGGTKVGSDADFASTHLRFVLGFLGITDVEVVVAKDVLAATAA